MLRLVKSSVIIILCLCLLLVVECTNKPKEYQHKVAQETVTLVRDAVKLIEAKGEAAFPKFEQKDSFWFHGNTYVFVWGLEGIRYVYPPNPAGEGENDLDLKDINGKPIGRMFVHIARNPKHEGWVHYQWPKPGALFPSWKSTYIMQATAPSGKKYLVGSGFYNDTMEKQFIVQAVDSAVELMKKKGTAAFNELRDKRSHFIFMDTYIFVTTADGTEVVNPAFPQIEGKNLIDHKDDTNKLIVREYIDALKDKKAAWVKYMWPKPGESQPSKKSTYVRKVEIGGKIYIVGAGIYLD